MRTLTLRRRVQFSETDAAGLVHVSCFFRYLEDAEHALWREAGLSIHPENSPIGWPRVSASCDFHRALRFEQEFDVVVRISEMTTRTITYADVRRLGGRELPVTLTVVPADKPAESTVVRYDDIAFDVGLDPDTFSLRTLQR